MSSQQVSTLQMCTQATILQTGCIQPCSFEKLLFSVHQVCAQGVLPAGRLPAVHAPWTAAHALVAPEEDWTHTCSSPWARAGGIRRNDSLAPTCLDLHKQQASRLRMRQGGDSFDAARIQGVPAKSELADRQPVLRIPSSFTGHSDRGKLGRA